MKILKIITFIIVTTIFTNTFCVLFYVKNDISRPIEAIITVRSGSDHKELRGWVKPGDQIQLDAKGGWLTNRISTSDPKFYKPDAYIYDKDEQTNYDQDVRFYNNQGMLRIQVNPHQ